MVHAYNPRSYQLEVAGLEVQVHALLRSKSSASVSSPPCLISLCKTYPTCKDWVCTCNMCTWHVSFIKQFKVDREVWSRVWAWSWSPWSTRKGSCLAYSILVAPGLPFDSKMTPVTVGIFTKFSFLDSFLSLDKTCSARTWDSWNVSPCLWGISGTLSPQPMTFAHPGCPCPQTPKLL